MSWAMRCITFEELRAVVDQAHAAGLLVTAHAHPLTAIRDAVAAGVDAIEHGTFVTETGIEVPDAVVASLVGSAIALCSALGKAPGMRLTPAALKFMRKIGMAYRCGHTVGQLHRARVYIVACAPSMPLRRLPPSRPLRAASVIVKVV
jgi:imidazolonepropionase-like amidohydrolase